MVIFSRVLLSLLAAAATYVGGFVVLFIVSLLGAGTILALSIIAGAVLVWLLLIRMIWRR